MQKEKKEENPKEIDIVEALSEIHEVNLEHLANRMLDHEKPYTHTEIHNPISMTALDTLASYLKDLELDGIINDFSYWLRVNFIAYMRKRATEMVEIIKGLKEKEQEKPTIPEVMLGR